MQHPALGRSCCTTPSAMCFWGAMFLLFYGVGLLLREVWPVLGPYGDTVILTALAAACLVNRHRTFHRGLTAPMFVIAAIGAGLIEAGIWTFDMTALWGGAALGVGLVLIVEWRTFARDQHRSSV